MIQKWYRGEVSDTVMPKYYKAFMTAENYALSRIELLLEKRIFSSEMIASVKARGVVMPLWLQEKVIQADKESLLSYAVDCFMEAAKTKKVAAKSGKSAQSAPSGAPVSIPADMTHVVGLLCRRRDGTYAACFGKSVFLSDAERKALPRIEFVKGKKTYTAGFDAEKNPLICSKNTGFRLLI